MTNRVLFVAFHFPPQAGSSGLLRSLKFAKYLPAQGWQPIVLSASPRAYESLDTSRLDEIPCGVEVVRAFALNAQKHLAVSGHYFKWTALPDRWVSWCLGAVLAGLRIIRRHQVDVIYSTFPIATAILIGLALHWLTGKPWVVDLRDSMVEGDYPQDPSVRSWYQWIERQAVLRATHLVFTARSTLQLYADRYPNLALQKSTLILNGYDEDDFKNLSPVSKNGHSRPAYFLHMGELYPEERDPRPFFRALGRLKKEGKADATTVRIGLRASGSEDYHAKFIREQGIEDFVQLLPPLRYREALQEGASSDALLVFQGALCNHQIPAKIYEYLRLRKPVLALTAEVGDTAAILKQSGGATIVDLADEEAIYRAFPTFLTSVQQGTHEPADLAKVEQYNRKSQAKELAGCLSQALASRAI
jgi:glycosyltransferase involved in cell wall biosynthesis